MVGLLFLRWCCDPLHTLTDIVDEVPPTQAVATYVFIGRLAVFLPMTAVGLLAFLLAGFAVGDFP